MFDRVFSNSGNVSASEMYHRSQMRMARNVCRANKYSNDVGIFAVEETILMITTGIVWDLRKVTSNAQI